MSSVRGLNDRPHTAMVLPCSEPRWRRSLRYSAGRGLASRHEAGCQPPSFEGAGVDGVVLSNSALCAETGVVLTSPAYAAARALDRGSARPARDGGEASLRFARCQGFGDSAYLGGPLTPCTWVTSWRR